MDQRMCTHRLTCLLSVSNNSNSNSHDNVYGAVIVAVHCHLGSSPGSSDECSTPSGCRPLDQADQPEPIDPPIGSYSDYIHHRHLLLLSPKADTHFTIPRRLSRPSWLVSDRDGLPACRQSPIQVLTGPAVEQLR